MTVLVVLSAGGLVYSGGGQAKPQSDPESLRNENELLKINLRATLERIRTLETKLGALTSQKARNPVGDLTRIHVQAGGAAKQAWNCLACHVPPNKDATGFHSVVGFTVKPVAADKAKADPNASGEYGERPLQVAVNCGNSDIVEQLLRAGARSDLKRCRSKRCRSSTIKKVSVQTLVSKLGFEKG